MFEYLEFKDAKCKDCYLCLRECPVKAIDIINHQAKIIKDRCILCGKCTLVCPQNAKIVHSEKNKVEILLRTNPKVIASVAPSFVSNFDVTDFEPFRIALCKLGFCDAHETAIGAEAVIKEYEKLMESGKFINFISSACPAACSMIQMYYPKALKYLAPVDSPMVAHAKMLKMAIPGASIVFIGPCIAKKREARESGFIDGVLTFEDIDVMFKENNIVPKEISHFEFNESADNHINLSKSFPVSQGIIKSFESLPEGFEYISVDGADRCVQVLENIETLSGVFLELSTCQNSCVNGPCILKSKGGSIKATLEVKKYVQKEKEKINSSTTNDNQNTENISFFQNYPRIRDKSKIGTEEEIKTILAKTGKFGPEDELNCGSCGYKSCRDKAWAVLNGYAEIEICLPYMRKRAESMSYEIIHNTADGVVVLDDSMHILEINKKAKEMFGIEEESLKGRLAVDFFNTADFMNAYRDNKNVEILKDFIPKTQLYVDISINILKEHRALFAMMRDVTAKVEYDDKLTKMKLETFETTDAVIRKQMRVAQEIASLLGETTAETKVALLKLKDIYKKE